MPLTVTLTFWRMDEKLPPTSDYYYVRFDNFLTEAYWNGSRWCDACGRYLPDFAQDYVTHWATEPVIEISSRALALLPGVENN